MESIIALILNKQLTFIDNMIKFMYVEGPKPIWHGYLESITFKTTVLFLLRF